MWPRNPPSVADLDLAVPPMPPRSRLFGLPPIGLGTSHVEGLVSYLVRLARAHSVNPRSLIRIEFRAIESKIGQLSYATFFARYAGTANGLGRYAEIFARCVERLAGLGIARAMTLLTLKGLFPANSAGLLADRPKWCPLCLKEMLQASQDAYRPLAWSFELYTVCDRHERPLEDTCGHCGRSQPCIPCYPDLGRCAHCHAQLAPRVDASKKGVLLPSSNKLERWSSRAIADLVEHLQSSAESVSRQRVIAFVNAAVNHQTNGNRAALCKRIGLPRWILTKWLSGKAKPSLPQFLSVCYGLGAMPSEIFRVGPEGHPLLLDYPLRKVPARLFDRAERPLPDATKRRQLASELDNMLSDPGTTLPMARIAEALLLGKSCLKYWFPVQYKALRDKHATARRRKTEERLLHDRQQVVAIVREMLERNEYPARRKVNDALRKRGASLIRHELRETYRKTMGLSKQEEM